MGISVLKQDGIVGFIKKLFERGTFNTISHVHSPSAGLYIWDIWRMVFRGYQKCRYHSNPNSFTDSDPLKLIAVDPNNINLRFDHKNNNSILQPLPTESGYFGKVIDGNWDENTLLIETRTHYRSIENVYKRGLEWEETNQYQQTLKEIKKGGQKWGCSTIEDLNKKCGHINSLYNSMSKEGYITQRDLIKEGLEIFPVREPVINIGKDGDLIHFRDGNHRIAIAKMLDLEYIFVRVGIRHSDWQAVRNSIRDMGPYQTIGDKHYLNHPDLQDLLV